jgi:Flp pilus assembly pilin Flp
VLECAAVQDGSSDQLVSDVRDREDGQGLIEYIVLIGLIALAVFAAVIVFEDEISKTFTGIGNRISSLP